MWDSEEIIQELKKRRKRITEQRRVMIDVIVEGDCRSFKELYVKVAKKRSDHRPGNGLPDASHAGGNRRD